jgi:inositol polyphosphate 5-phosphatase INPP5B/F
MRQPTTSRLHQQHARSTPVLAVRGELATTSPATQPQSTTATGPTASEQQPFSESGVLVVSRDETTLKVKAALPVLADLRLQRLSSSVVQLSYEHRGGQALRLQCASAVRAQALYARVDAALQRAQRSGYTQFSGTHTWLPAAARPQGVTSLAERALDSLSAARRVRQTDSEAAGDTAGAARPWANPLVSLAQQGGEAASRSRVVDVKEEWIETQLQRRAEEFTERCELNLFLGTWNVNGRKPVHNLDEWMLRALPEGLDPPAVFALGFQELDLTAEALLLGDTARAAPWEQAGLRTLQQLAPYRLMLSKQLVGMLLCVYVRADLAPVLVSPLSAAAGVGIMGMMGNKGGVAVRFQLHDSTFCLVNTHLSAHQENVLRRNQDYHEISRRLQFTLPSGATIGIHEHDHLFWMGDLNYRIDLADDDLKAAIRVGDWDTLFAADQLREQMAARTTFDGFAEGRLCFAPTYKYDVGSLSYDTSEKRRTPAWCDRVLWRHSGAVRQLAYGRHELLASDHRPVSALFAVQARVTMPEHRAAVYRDLVRELDKLENESLPNAELSANQLEFGEVRFLMPRAQSLELVNSGQVVVRYRFIPKFDERTVCPPWLQVSPLFGMLVPGERVQLRFRVLVDATCAPQLNGGDGQLSDVLILHLENGKDMFVGLSATYLVSAFGSSLSYLTRFPGPVRDGSPLPADSEQRLSIPKEVWLLVDHLFAHCLDSRDLFLGSGESHEMELARECIDTGKPLDPARISADSVADTLTRLLESLPEPVMPRSLLKQCLDCSADHEQCKQVLTFLPLVHYNVFYYLMAFARELLLHSEQNELSGEQLAVIMAEMLFRLPKNASAVARQCTVRFLSHFFGDQFSV